MKMVCRSCGAGMAYADKKDEHRCVSCGCRHGFFSPSPEPITSLIVLLRNTGAENPLPAHTICQLCGISGTKLRSLVHDLRMDGTPIGSGPEGYFLARHPDDLDATIEQSMSRAASIQQFVLALQRTKGKMKERS